IISSYKSSGSLIHSIVAINPYRGEESSVEHVEYVNNRNFNYRGNNMPNYYHAGLRNHKNLSYGNNRNVLQPPPGYDNKAPKKKPLFGR
ncbi:hypothetical protein, partial [Proteus mirabilis]|uniref:hypothetical protein n=1 Tax=Proteus mirabilis TaxID=584 RepID=UPI001C12E1EF